MENGSGSAASVKAPPALLPTSPPSRRCIQWWRSRPGPGPGLATAAPTKPRAGASPSCGRCLRLDLAVPSPANPGSGSGDGGPDQASQPAPTLAVATAYKLLFSPIYNKIGFCRKMHPMLTSSQRNHSFRLSVGHDRTQDNYG